ncbi:MAG: hypothetical protein JF610_08490 [Acidobacteria bacterium]|nr:hypothetical protein [Acidobacteriota bacterium]
MIGPHRKTSNALPRFVLACIAAMLAALVAACGTDYFEIPIETPIQPKLDVSPFQRVLVIGFVAGGTDDVDANQETVRLLRSQLRTKSSLKVIDADILPLIEVARDQSQQTPSDDANGPRGEGSAPPRANANGNGAGVGERIQGVALPPNIKDEKDLEPYERLFANTAYWKRIGEEFQNPLIVTGTVLFTNRSTSGFVQRDQETFDSLGRRRVMPMRTYMERKGFILRPKFVFIDGRTGATMYSESYREEILYNAQQNTPALSSYFELMDRLVPNFLSALSSQKIRGTRVLLK